MDLKISFEPFSPNAPDLFVAVAQDGIEDARVIARASAAANRPTSLMFLIQDAFGVVLERWENVDDAWRPSRGNADTG